MSATETPAPKPNTPPAGPEREQLEREWADAAHRGLRKGKMPAASQPAKKAAGMKATTKNGRRRK
jgi:hypothetical protein